MDKDLQERWNKAVAMKNSFVPQLEKSDWNQRCLESMRREKIEIEKRYGIKIGQTDIYCERCARPWGFGGHTCQDVRFKQLQEREKERQEALRCQKENLLNRIREMGAKKVSIMLYQEIEDSGGNKVVIRDIPEGTVTTWIKRGSVPKKHIENIEALINSVRV